MNEGFLTTYAWKQLCKSRGLDFPGYHFVSNLLPDERLRLFKRINDIKQNETELNLHVYEAKYDGEDIIAASWAAPNLWGGFPHADYWSIWKPDSETERFKQFVDAVDLNNIPEGK